MMKLSILIILFTTSFIQSQNLFKTQKDFKALSELSQTGFLSISQNVCNCYEEHQSKSNEFYSSLESINQTKKNGNKPSKQQLDNLKKSFKNVQVYFNCVENYKIPENQEQAIQEDLNNKFNPRPDLKELNIKELNTLKIVVTTFLLYRDCGTEISFKYASMKAFYEAIKEKAQ